VRGVQLRYFKMDIELLFSNKPFENDEVSANVVMPNVIVDVGDVLPVGGQTEVDIPNSLRAENVLIEATTLGGPTRSVMRYAAPRFELHIAEKYGHLHLRQSTDEPSAASLPGPCRGAYVKVYARLKEGGATRFWKDGYTDLRAKFDYVTISGASVATVAHFAVLIIVPDLGVAWRKIRPPGGGAT